jgi:hypothetical protein
MGALTAAPGEILAARRRSALPSTESEPKVLAATAMIELSKSPENG